MNIPTSVAIIMDGNGRWAKKMNMPRSYGHKMGAKNLEKICKVSDEIGIKYLTVYAFSTENWNRPKDEVDTLMHLMDIYFNKCIKTCKRDNMRFFVIGDRSILSDKLNNTIDKLIDVSKDYTGLTLVIAINYGGRDEIRRACNKLLKNKLFLYKKFISEDKSLLYDDNFIEDKLLNIKEKDIENELDTKNIPFPDLLIRTSGEMRLSNFLPWQLSYTEFYFTDKNWPEFDGNELKKAVLAYQDRHRRFGKI